MSQHAPTLEIEINCFFHVQTRRSILELLPGKHYSFKNDIDCALSFTVSSVCWWVKVPAIYLLCRGLSILRHMHLVQAHLGFAEVESNEYCRKVLRMRMLEKMLPEGIIECDVVTVKPPPKCRGVGGGFPCQAGFCFFSAFP